MKNRRWLVFGLLGLVLVIGLAGCIVSATPDSLKTVVMKPGETIEFKVVGIPQSACSWELDGIDLTETSSTFTYAPKVADLGEHYLWVGTSNTGRFWNISVEQGPPTKWERTYGTGAYLSYEDAYTIQQTSDGGYIAAGKFNVGLIVNAITGCIIKMDSSGKTEWRKMFDLTDLESATSVQQTSDGGYIVAGDNFKNDDYGSYACSIIKLDASGTITWKRSFSDDSPGYSKGIIMSIQQTDDGGYIAAGYSRCMNISGVTNHGGFDYYIIRLDAAGNVEWQRMYGGSSGDLARSIRQTVDGGYIVAGYSDSEDIEGVTGEGNYYIFKLDSSGDAVWQRLYDTRSEENYHYDSGPSSIQETIDGGYIVVGSSEESSDLPYDYNRTGGCHVIKLDAVGNVAWQKSYWAVTGNAIQQTTDGGYIIAGYRSETIYPNPVATPWERNNGRLLKLDGSGNKEWEQQYRKNAGIKLFDVHQTADGGYVAAGGCDLGTVSSVLGFWPDPQSGPDWEWENIYVGNYDDWYILKLGPDGEMQ